MVESSENFINVYIVTFEFGANAAATGGNWSSKNLHWPSSSGRINCIILFVRSRARALNESFLFFLLDEILPAFGHLCRYMHRINDACLLAVTSRPICN